VGSTGDLTLPSGKETSDAIAWSKQRGGVYLPSPIVHNELLYTVNNNGILTAYEAKTGNRVYQQRVGDGGSFTASPVIAADRIYIATEDGDVYVVKAGKEYELLAKNKVGEAILSTPALTGDMILVRGERHLFAIKEMPH
jgi:outer membrane protein assembly factor BamB